MSLKAPVRPTFISWRDWFSFYVDMAADYVRPPSDIKTFRFFVNCTIVDSEITGNLTLCLKGERWNLEHRFGVKKNPNGHGSHFFYSATLTPAEQDGIVVESKVRYCEMSIEYYNFNNKVRIESIKNIRNDNKFEFDMKIHNCSLGTYEIHFTFGYSSSTKNSADVLSSMKKMQTESILTDFVIKTTEVDIPCHKLVLAACSDFFQNMFAAQMKESVENVLHWEDVFDETTVQDLLHFIYTGDKPTNITKTCFSLVEAAHMCLLVVLKEMCEAEIVPRVKADNVVEILVMGEKFESQELKQTALNFMAENLASFNGDVTQLPGWNQVEPEMGKSLMASFIKMIGIGRIKV